MSRDCRHLESLLHHDIPITKALGLAVRDWSEQRLQLHAPLDANINHASTMFGGSLYCVAVLAGWGWLYLRLREAGRGARLGTLRDHLPPPWSRAHHPAVAHRHRERRGWGALYRSVRAAPLRAHAT